jgi:hypothetical protein
MTDLRQAAQQALDALRSSTNYRSGSAIQVEAVENLCEALEQPQQVDCPRCGHVCSQRPWVGLTDDQIDEIAVIARRGNLHDLRIAIEAKLKERNT